VWQEPCPSRSRCCSAWAGAWRLGRGTAPAAARDLTAFKRWQLWQALQPVTLANCDLQRFGEAHDVGRLGCANLLPSVAAVYPYGLSDYDGWGCQVATTLREPHLTERTADEVSSPRQQATPQDRTRASAGTHSPRLQRAECRQCGLNEVAQLVREVAEPLVFPIRGGRVGFDRQRRDGVADVSVVVDHLRDRHALME